MHDFNLKVLTSDGILYQGAVQSANIPTFAGQITVLNHHSPLVSVIGIGELKIIDTQKVEHIFYIQGGIVHAKGNNGNNEVVLLIDSTVDLEQGNFENEIARAKEAMSMKKEEYEFAEEESALERALYLKRRTK